MRVVLGVALVGLVVCVGCGRKPDAVSHEPIQPKVSKEAGSPEPPPLQSPQEKAIAAIKKLGGAVKFDQNETVVFVNLFDTNVTDAGLVHLKGLTKLEHLHLKNTKVTDAGLVHLKGMTTLTRLLLNYTKVTDAGLVHLKGLTSLESLTLIGTKVTDAGIKSLSLALPKCRIRLREPEAGDS